MFCGIELCFENKTDIILLTLSIPLMLNKLWLYSYIYYVSIMNSCCGLTLCIPVSHREGRQFDSLEKLTKFLSSLNVSRNLETETALMAIAH